MNMRTWKRILAGLLCAVMVLSNAPLSSTAAQTAQASEAADTAGESGKTDDASTSGTDSTAASADKTDEAGGTDEAGSTDGTGATDAANDAAGDTSSEGANDTQEDEAPTANDAVTPAMAPAAAPANNTAEVLEDENGTYFILTASTSSKTLIEPVKVYYTEGQTVKDALLATDYSFSGLDQQSPMVDAIQGEVGNYTVHFDAEDKYSFSLSASETGGVVVFSESVPYSAELVSLVKVMGEYNAKTNNVQKYTAASTAYQSALNALRSGVSDSSLEDKLTAAIEEYEALIAAGSIAVTVTATQGGATAENPVITFTDSYGNVTTATDGTALLRAETYTFVVSDGGYNRTEGSFTVSEEATSLAVTLPSGEWYGDIKLSHRTTKQAYESAQDTATHTAVYHIPDTDNGGVYINAAQGSDIPDSAATTIWALYTKTTGEEYETQRSWSSTTTMLGTLLASGMQEQKVVLEARYTGSDGYTMIQSYDLALTRIATCSDIVLKDGNGSSLVSDFSATKTAYEVNTINDTMTVEAVPFGEDYTVAVSLDGQTLESNTFTLGENPNMVKVTVTGPAGGDSSIYSFSVKKVDPLEVTLKLPDGVTAEVYNAGGSLIQPKTENGNVYDLIPEATYTYVSTKQENYHATASFTVNASGSSQSVDVAAPEVKDVLTNFVVYSSSPVKTRVELPADEAFSSSRYTYTYTVPDTYSNLYVQADRSDTSYNYYVSYLQQSTNTPSRDGAKQDWKKMSYSVVSTSKNASQFASYFLASCGYGNTATLRLLKTTGSGTSQVEYYQDYQVKVNRSLSLKSLSVSNELGELTLTDENGAKLSYVWDTYEYYASVSADCTELTLAAHFQTELDTTPSSGGYHAVVNGEEYADLSAVTLPLDTSKQEESVSIQVGHKDTEAVSKTYTLHIKKQEPVKVSFKTTPENAIVFVINEISGKPVYAENGVYSLMPGVGYTYTVTASGYKAQKVTGYKVAADDANVTVEVTLEKAEANTSLPDYQVDENDWPSFRDEENNGVVSVETPTTAEDSALYWASKMGEGYGSSATGCPILVDGYLYTYAGNKIYKIDSVNGKTVAEGTMAASSAFAIMPPTYGDGMIFVGLSNGQIQAFNAADLTSLWVYKDDLGGQPNCSITYKDGYIYTGFWNSEIKDANYACISVTDEDPGSTNETKVASWVYTSQGGFYWAGAYVSDDFMLVGTDDGEQAYSTGHARIVSLDPKSGAILDEVTLPDVGDLRCNITRDGDCYYFTTKGGYFYKIRANEDGTFVEGSLQSVYLPNGTSTQSMSTSTPTIYNGRAYVGVSGSAQFGDYSGHNMTVIDLETMTVAYSIYTQGYPQTSGLVTTAYEEEGKVYVYFFDNYTPGKLRVFSDMPGQTEPNEEDLTTETNAKGETFTVGRVLFTPSGSQAQYAICSPIVDEYGFIYFKNDSAYVMALGPTVESVEITKQPDKTTYKVGDTFDATGMEVTIHYSNGKSRVVTDYVSYSTDPLTAEDTAFEIRFDTGFSMYQDKDGQTGVDYDAPSAVVNLTFTSEEDTSAAKAVDEKIEAIGTVTLDSEEAITEARTAYDALTDAQKTQVTKLSTLEAAEAKLAELKAAKADQDAADAVEAKIEAIGTVTLDSEDAIKAARTAYDGLTDGQKALVKNLQTLTDAEKKLAELQAEKKAEEEKKAADEAAAKAVDDQIAALGEVTLDSEDAIKAARTAYDGLTDDQKALVKNLQTLTDAEKKLAELQAEKKAEEEKKAADEAAAKAVDDQIAALGEVTLDSENAIKAARTAYDGLTADQKAYVKNLSTLEAAETKLAQLKADKADKEAAAAVETKIAAIGNVTLDSENAIKEARTVYDKLTDTQKKLVSNLQTLTDAETKLEELKTAKANQDAADAVDAKITAIGTVTLDSEDAIKAARTAYDKLTADQKALVKNLQTLTDAEKKLAELQAEKKAEEEKKAADEAAAKAVDDQIAALGEVTLNSEDAIKAARTAYDKLTSDQKTLVTKLDTLTAAEAKLEELKTAKANQDAADAVDAKITAIGTVTLDSENKIKEARTAYDKLTETQQKLVKNLQTLTDAEKKLAELQAEKKAEEEKKAADEAAAKTVDDQIAALGEVTLNSEDAIKAARTAYDGLTADQKAYVKNLSTLEAAETKLAQLKADKADKEAAAAVETKIAAIGNVTLDSENAIKEARTAYDKLTDTQKKLVSNLQTLTDAETKLAELKTAKANQEAADAVDQKIADIGTVTLDSENKIKEARTAYDKLTADQKALVKNLQTLTDAEKKLAELQAEKKAEEEKKAADEAAAKAVDDQIAALGEVTLNSEDAIKAARAAYDKLTSDQKALVTKLDTLTAAEAKLEELKTAKANQDAADAVDQKIADIGTVTLDSEKAIKDARTAYDALTADQKALVKNLQTLTDAEKKLAELQAEKKAEEEKKAADEAAAKAVDDQIAALGEVTLDSEDAIKEARTAYDGLTADQKAYVKNLSTLEAAETKLAQLKADKVDKEAAAAVETKIAAIGNVTLDSENAIKEARTAYDKLTDTQKKLVSNLQTLTDAEAKLEELKTAKANQEAADAVDQKIADIGTVTLDSENKIKEARTAYDKLTADQKALVKNLQTLTDAEKKLAELQAEKKAEEDKKAAEAVDSKISAIGDVTLDSEKAIKDARAAYNALTADQKNLVQNLQTLTDAEKKLAELQAEKKAEEDKKAAEAVDSKISAIGDVTLNSEKAIKDARAAYNALTADQKALVQNLKTLTDAEAKLQTLKDEAKKKEDSKKDNKSDTKSDTKTDSKTDTKKSSGSGSTGSSSSKTTQTTPATTGNTANSGQSKEDKKAAADVDTQIEAIGDVTLDSEKAIQDARAAYDALTAEQKELVQNLNELMDAEDELQALKDEAETEEDSTADTKDDAEDSTKDSSDSENADSSDSQADETTSEKSGSNLWLFIVALLVVAAGVVIWIIAKKKKNEEDESGE